MLATKTILSVKSAKAIRNQKLLFGAFDKRWFIAGFYITAAWIIFLLLYATLSIVPGYIYTYYTDNDTQSKPSIIELIFLIACFFAIICGLFVCIFDGILLLNKGKKSDA